MPLECTHEQNDFNKIGFCNEATFNVEGGGSKHTKLQDYGEHRIPVSCFKSRGCQQNCMFGALCMFQVLLAPIFSQIQP